MFDKQESVEIERTYNGQRREKTTAYREWERFEKNYQV